MTLEKALLGKRARRPSSRAWGPRAIHENNVHSNTPCCLSVVGPGCGLELYECNNRVLRSDQTEVRELLGIGRGVFALEDLTEGQWVGEYSGKLTVSRTRPSIPSRKQYTLCGSCGNAGWVVVEADNVHKAKRVVCHFINHACGASANCDICWVADDKEIHRPFYRLNKTVRAGQQLTVDYRCFSFEAGCLCEACTGLTNYSQMDYAGAAERLCMPSVTGKGLFVSTAVEAGRTIGFFVGELVLFDLCREKGDLGLAQTLHVSSRPPWVPCDLWKTFDGPNGVVIDARSARPGFQSKAPVSCVRLVPEPTSNCKFTEAGVLVCTKTIEKGEEVLAASTSNV